MKGPCETGMLCSFEGAGKKRNKNQIKKKGQRIGRDSNCKKLVADI